MHPVTAVIRARAAAGGPLLGAYYLKPNFAARAAHIANAGYVVAASARGRGIGRALVRGLGVAGPVAGFRCGAIQPRVRLQSGSGVVRGARLEGDRPDPHAVDGEEAVIYWRRVGDPPPP